MKWRKVTIIFILSTLAVIIGYDVLVVINSENDTISNVTMSALWKFPFVIYGWMVLGGHFLSLFKTKKRYIKQLIIVSIPVLILSFLTAFNVMKVNAWMLGAVSIQGVIVGLTCWSQRRDDSI